MEVLQGSWPSEFSHSLGQNRKSSMRANVFRFAPESGHAVDVGVCGRRRLHHQTTKPSDPKLPGEVTVEGLRTWCPGHTQTWRVPRGVTPLDGSMAPPTCTPKVTSESNDPMVLWLCREA